MDGGLRFLASRRAGLAAGALVGGVETPLDGAVGGAATGAVVGLAQWLVLRQRRPLSAWWIAATSGGMALGLALGVTLFGISTENPALPLRALVTGAAIGGAQMTLLRGWRREAFIWPATVGAGWLIGWLITRAAGVNLEPNWSVFGSTGAWAFQLLTGLALAWLLRRR